MKHLFFILVCLAVLGTTNATTPNSGSQEEAWIRSFPFVDEKTVDIYQIHNDLVVYPNPASVEFFIRFEVGDKSNVSISLFDALGREVKILQRNISISDSQILQFGVDQGIPNGRYFVRVEADGKQYVKSLIIKH
jgi:hypothetical protein